MKELIRSVRMSLSVPTAIFITVLFAAAELAILKSTAIKRKGS